MASRTFFPQERQLLTESVMSTGVAVSAAAPGGIAGLLKEGSVTARVLAESDRPCASPQIWPRTAARQVE